MFIQVREKVWDDGGMVWDVLLVECGSERILRGNISDWETAHLMGATLADRRGLFLRSCPEPR